MTETTHVCSRLPYTCDACGFADTRDAFECFVADADYTNARFAVICPKCEEYQKDGSNWDDNDCEACMDEWVD